MSIDTGTPVMAAAGRFEQEHDHGRRPPRARAAASRPAARITSSSTRSWRGRAPAPGRRSAPRPAASGRKPGQRPCTGSRARPLERKCLDEPDHPVLGGDVAGLERRRRERVRGGDHARSARPGSRQAPPRRTGRAGTALSGAARAACPIAPPGTRRWGRRAGSRRSGRSRRAGRTLERLRRRRLLLPSRVVRSASSTSTAVHVPAVVPGGARRSPSPSRPRPVTSAARRPVTCSGSHGHRPVSLVGHGRLEKIARAEPAERRVEYDQVKGPLDLAEYVAVANFYPVSNAVARRVAPRRDDGAEDSCPPPVPRHPWWPRERRRPRFRCPCPGPDHLREPARGPPRPADATPE